MTDYAKWKVTDLKAELKRRGIPQTGLRVKQQIIDRLVEEDAQQGTEAVANGESPVEQDAAPETTQPVESEPVPEPEPEQEPEPTADAPAKPENLEPEGKEDQYAEPVQEPTQEQVQGDAVNETKPEPVAPNEKAAEQEQVQFEEPTQESPKQDEPAEPTDADQPTDAIMTDQPPDTTMVEPADQTKTETAAAPVEQAPGEAAEQSAMVEPKGAELAASDETAPPVAIPSEMNTALSTPLPTEEVLEDRRKRKRRSQSPVPTPDVLAHKKAKAQDETPRVLLPEDQEAQEREARQDGREDSGPQGTPEERAGPETASEHDAPPVQDETSKKGAPLKHDVRFKGLFAAKDTQQTRPVSPPPDAVMEDADVEPALHVATAALYVGGLMRPLQPVALRNHLVSLASPPDAAPNPDVVVDFYLDPIKTHCFVSFTAVAAASRVRTALHGTVWPNERNRKTLFVDFIPEDKLSQWIEKEEGARQRSGPPPRWEVRYEPTEDGVEAVLGEIDPRSAGSQPARGPESSGFSRPPPTGPRAEMGGPGRRPSGEAPADSSSRPGQGFKPLDELFMSTTTKPKLYYLPVPREVADRRLDRFDDLLRKGEYPRRGGDEPRRITFEDDDYFVDNGPDFGGNGRNRRGRGGRGGRGRGGFGDSWRDDRRSRY
ncbi:SAP domain protein [Aspergillus ibericus CBS 121593]|uniref:SAP domain-containing protein n=1 Tax=Aspergillus ibericus CBS 121593 TaxID=1448316 RepID=A0A395GIX5_9EURO|nr:hypothetical protein BO80DRAFT_430107 [Aspergillus ibericus CBS 121593]RAK95156.1 hypothetical protein BO80DRAFT_430107 [Aspergillus ibericus CBS 121593]